jgi:hypothetical protein
MRPTSPESDIKVGTFHLCPVVSGDEMTNPIPLAVTYDGLEDYMMRPLPHLGKLAISIQESNTSCG